MLRRLVLATVVLAVALLVGVPHGPARALAATSADYPNQAAAQAAGDTRDADGDGIYCESLLCPCSTAPPTSTPAPSPPPARVPTPAPTPPVTSTPAPAPARAR